MLLSFAIENIPKNIKVRRLLAADVGATKTNIALYDIGLESWKLVKEDKYLSSAFPGFIAIAEHFLQDTVLPEVMSIGVAGPVLNNKAKLANLHWEVDGVEIANYFGIKSVYLLNDLEATAYGLALLEKKDTSIIQEGDASIQGNAAIIAPGTGLGEAGLFWNGRNYHPFATEGGHCDFAPRDSFDVELYTFLQQKFGHVSWERVLCGPGIVNIYEFLKEMKKMQEPGWLKQEFGKNDAAAMISKYVHDADICLKTMELFVRYLALESANLVLKLKATGGLFIGGGIAPKVLPLLQNGVFRTNFRQSGRLNYLLDIVPVTVLMNTKTALLGAAFYGAHSSG
ncbi:MAG: glucokinase [Bacteroidota bacterium]|nr:glucokinase [Bacteroidota bacterium]